MYALVSLIVTRDYTDLLNLDRDYSVADITVNEGEWLTDERLADLELRLAEGVTILGIEREDGTDIGALEAHRRAGVIAARPFRRNLGYIH